MVKKFSKHTPEQIVRKLDKARELKESGSTTAQISIELGIIEATLDWWQGVYGSMTNSEGKELCDFVTKRRVWIKVLAEGYGICRETFRWVWREEGLRVVPRKKRKRLSTPTRREVLAGQYMGDVWALDFQFDST